jgi:CubicO group peptidase (beta-lactamase class C family)
MDTDLRAVPIAGPSAGHPPSRAWPAVVVLALTMLAAPGCLQAQATPLGALIDRELARHVSVAAGPGCTVGVRHDGQTVTRAGGQADLERAVPLAPVSILEAGSVSKQFTAAAVLLLALDGRVDLDGDVHRWFPELPEYDRPITVRHLLTHTSGLRDWGAIVALEGWPRGTRAHTNAHVVEVAARQQALNYAPGATYSYTNTGYNLLAVLVQRVSGQSLAEFTRERLFVPLGMTATSWRDDHRRVVPGRALAYGPGLTPATDMPNEHAYGNGGLLTTVDDLLRWTDALAQGTLGTAFDAGLTRRAVLTNGDTVPYALGVNVLRHRGTRELSHSGATGGYRAHLLAFPERGTGIAVLCNGAALNATQIAEVLADSLIGRRTRQPAPVGPGRPVRVTARPGGTAPSARERLELTGVYASPEVGGAPLEIAMDGEQLVLRQAPGTRLLLQLAADGRFVAGSRVLWFDRDAAGRVTALHVGQDRAWDVVFPRVGNIPLREVGAPPPQP